MISCAVLDFLFFIGGFHVAVPLSEGLPDFPEVGSLPSELCGLPREFLYRLSMNSFMVSGLISLPAIAHSQHR